MSKLTPEERKAIIERLTEIASLIEQICEAPGKPKPGEYDALIHERADLKRQLEDDS